MSNVIRFRRNGLAHKISPQDVKQRLINPSKDVELKQIKYLELILKACHMMSF